MAVKKKPNRKRQPRKDEMAHVEQLDRRETSHSLGYLIAKMESLDRFIRDHMDKEEKTTTDLYRRLEEATTRLNQFRIIQVVLLIGVLIIASGTPFGAIVLKLIGHL